LKKQIRFGYYLTVLNILIFSTLACQARPRHHAPTVILQIKRQKIKVEIARTVVDRAIGLMFRNHLKWNHGMIFIFHHSQILQFWMKNTEIPLSVAFLNKKGRIINIDRMFPETETIHDSIEPALYALEMNLNWFSKHHIHPGERVKGLTILKKIKKNN
jgi:uncharacterized membrane protein (UPF0127 family)